MAHRPWRVTDAGVRIEIRLTPRARTDAVDGIDTAAPTGPVLRCRVRALPHEGQANAALVGLLALWLDVPRSNLSILKGSSSRTKAVLVSGDAPALEARLTRLLG